MTPLRTSAKNAPARPVSRQSPSGVIPISEAPPAGGRYGTSNTRPTAILDDQAARFLRQVGERTDAIFSDLNCHSSLCRYVDNDTPVSLELASTSNSSLEHPNEIRPFDFRERHRAMLNLCRWTRDGPGCERWDCRL